MEAMRASAAMYVLPGSSSLENVVFSASRCDNCSAIIGSVPEAKMTRVAKNKTMIVCGRRTDYHLVPAPV